MLDLFILHATTEADAVFARALGPALGLADDRVLLSSRLPPGLSIVQAIANGVASAAVTVAIVSPSFLHDQWAQFGEELAGHYAVEGGRLVPLLLFDCELPLRLRYRTLLDCRAPADRPDAYRRLTALLGAPAPKEREIPCPYPGLRPYRADDAAVFCGRDDEVRDLVSRIAGGAREVYVVGPSGSGKSSLLLAGVGPRLARAGDPVVGEPFAVRAFRPGDDPAARLAATVAELPADRRALVIVDQLEEIFTLADADRRRGFVAALAPLRARATLHLAFTLRADFLGALINSELWPTARRAFRVEVGPLRDDALRAALTEPARRVGVSLEPALVDAILADAAAEPGVLPLVQEALVDLWATRRGNLLTAADYAALGSDGASGLAAALARRADIAFGTLDDAGQAAARRIFLRLVAFGQGRADTRRQQPRAALAPDLATGRVLDALTEARLLTATADAIDLAHEILISAWPRLRGWIAAHRRDEHYRRELVGKTEAWIERGAGPAGLLDRFELAEADKWLATPGAAEVGHGADVDRLVARSRAVLTAAATRTRRRTIATIAALAGFSLLATVLGILALRSRGEVAGQRDQLARTNQQLADRIAETQQLLIAQWLTDGVAQLDAGEPGAAFDTLASAYDLDRFTAPGGSAHRAAIAAAFAQAITVKEAHRFRWTPPPAPVPPAVPVTAAGTGDRVTLLGTAIQDGFARWLEARSTTLAVTPDGARIAVGRDVIDVLDRDGASLFTIDDPIAGDSPKLARPFLLLPDGDTVVTYGFEAPTRVWSVRARGPVRELPAVRGARLDGRTLVDDAGQLWDLDTGERRAGTAPPAPVRDLVVPVVEAQGPLGRAEAAGERLTLTGAVPTEGPTTLPMRADALAFDESGGLLAVASRDRVHVLSIWHGLDLAVVDLPGEVSAVALAGGRLYAARRGGVDAFDLDRLLHRPVRVDGTIAWFAWCGAGRVGVLDDAGTLRVVDPADRRPRPIGARGTIAAAACDAGGHRLVTLDTGGALATWDPATGERLASAPTGEAALSVLDSAIAIDREATRAVVVAVANSGDGAVSLWDLTGPTVIRRFGPAEAVADVEAVDLDGASVLTRADAAWLAWRARDGALERAVPAYSQHGQLGGGGRWIVDDGAAGAYVAIELEVGRTVRIASTPPTDPGLITPDGSRLFTNRLGGPGANHFTIWSLPTPERPDREVVAIGAGDGLIGDRRMVGAELVVASSASADGAAVYELATGRRLFSIAATPAAHTFSPDGSTLLVQQGPSTLALVRVTEERPSDEVRALDRPTAAAGDGPVAAVSPAWTLADRVAAVRALETLLAAAAPAEAGPIHAALADALDALAPLQPAAEAAATRDRAARERAAAGAR